MRKMPYRPSNEITQPFNDGVVIFYCIDNIAEPGYEPKEGLQLKVTLRFELQRLGINRLYLSKQNQAEIAEVIRVPRNTQISNQDIAVINGNDKKQYIVESIQTVLGVWPESMDIALRRIEQNYEIT